MNRTHARPGRFGRILVFCLLALLGAAGAVEAQNRVNVMPGFPNLPNCDPSQKRLVRPGSPLIAWGNANGGNGSANGLPYSWSFSANPNVLVSPVSPPLNGTISDDHYIFEEVTFTLLNGSTDECVTATLTVTFPGPTPISDAVEIRIVDPSDPSSTAPLDNLAIDADIAREDGLRYLYVSQLADGSWASSNAAYKCATTGFALWAIQNHGHLPSNDPNQDIFAEFVDRGLEYLLSNAAVAGIAAANADVARGATAPGISDLNSNGRSINLCPGTNNYSHPVACAAIIASLEPTRLVATGPFSGDTFQTILEDAIDYIGSQQNSSPASGPRGGWNYSGPSTRSDMSVNSWNYLALEGIEAIAPLCDASGGSGGIQVPDWIKQEAEYALVFHQTNAAGPQPFGYDSATPLRGGHHGIATTGGGLSGLALVESEQTVPIADIIDNELAPLNTVAAKRQAALDYLGACWNETTNANSLGYGNRGDFYAMWTAARALRITAKALALPAGQPVILTHSAVNFDWRTGETQPAVGNVPPAGDPREGYFPYLVRTQDTVSGPTLRGRWNQSYLGSYGVSMDTSLGVLILGDRVFGPECEISCEDIVVPCQGPQGAIVNFNILTAGCSDGTVIECDPPTGSLFPIGVTDVICYAVEPCGDRRSLPCCFTVTVEDKCECLEIVDRRLECSREVPGEYDYTFTLTNQSGVPVTRVRLLPCDDDGDLLPDFDIAPSFFNLPSPLPDGASTTLSVTMTGLVPEQPNCFEVWMFDERFRRCCVTKHCITPPNCCIEVIDPRIECDPANPGAWTYSFRILNQSAIPIDRLFLWPQGGFTFTPASFLVAPIPTGGLSPVLTTTITGASAGDQICFEISVHEEATGDCCASDPICLVLPDCDPCDKDDFCRVTPESVLCRVQGSDVLQAQIKFTVCNTCSEEPVRFDVSFDGTTGPDCPVQYLTPANFMPSSGLTPAVPLGECRTFGVTIQVFPGEIPPDACACFVANVTNTVTGESFACRGVVKAPKQPIKGHGDPADPVDVATPEGRDVVFQVENTGDVEVRATLLVSTQRETEGGTPPAVISLDGLPPGEPVRRVVQLPPRGVADLPLSVRFAQHLSLEFVELNLLLESAEGTIFLASTAVRSVVDDDCNRNGIADEAELNAGLLSDRNGDGIPDECRSPLEPGKQAFRRGDANADSRVDVSDGINVLEVLFTGRTLRGCEEAYDTDDNGTIGIGDAIGIFGFLFLAAEEPVSPGPWGCGFDVTPDNLTCNEYPTCALN